LRSRAAPRRKASRWPSCVVCLCYHWEGWETA